MKFSIITITFNSEKTVERALKSVLNQTYKDYEYIIVDGASKDGTMDIVRKYEPLFEGRMKWKSEPDTGIYNAMNKGIMRSTGEIIGIVNSDDWLEPDALESIAAVTKGKNAIDESLYCGSLWFHYQNGQFQLLSSNKTKFLAGIKRGSLNHGVFHPAIFVGRSVYSKVGLFDENFRTAADTDFINRCYSYGCEFVFTPKPISHMQDGGASNGLNFHKIINDAKYSCEKKGIPAPRMFLFCLGKCLEKTIKYCVPDSALMLFRKIGNK